MKPLLAHVYEPHRVTFPCYVQPKLNGIRALYQAGHFQSRDEHPFPVGLLEHLAAPLRQVFDESVILDGELYVHGWPLQRINAAVTPVRKEESEDTKSVEYHVFDRINFYNDFATRFLCPPFLRLPNCHQVDTYKVHSSIEADQYYAKFVSDGYEGMMYRLGDCPYTMPKQKTDQGWHQGRFSRSPFLSDQNNRCWHLLKRKSWQDEEFEIVGVVEGEGRLAGMLGAITCSRTHGPNEGRGVFATSTFSVGSGFTDSDRDKYWDHPELAIGKLAKVKFLCLSEDGIPLNPTLLAIL